MLFIKNNSSDYALSAGCESFTAELHAPRQMLRATSLLDRTRKLVATTPASAEEGTTERLVCSQRKGKNIPTTEISLSAGKMTQTKQRKRPSARNAFSHAVDHLAAQVYTSSQGSALKGGWHLPC